MTQRQHIIDLARRAGATDEHGGPAKTVFCFTAGELQGFAELLVQECVAQNKIAIQSLKDHPEDIPGWKTMMNLAQVTCQNQIAEHFGVDL